MLVLSLSALSLVLATPARANGTAQAIPFSQNWSTTTQITAPPDNNWNNVPGINGYLGGDITFTAGSNPQTIVDDGAGTGLNVKANQSNPNTLTLGGVAEFDRSPTTNPVVALQPTDTADLPHLVMTLDTRNKKNVNVSYLLRDIDGSADNVAQQLVLQYRVGSSGVYTNLPAGYVADATTGPSLATKTTPVSVTLPAAADNQAQVQVRVGSANAAGTDEWVGVDDISVSSVPDVSISGPASPNEGTTQTYNYTVSDTDSSDNFTLKSGFPDCGTGGTFVSGSHTQTTSGGSFQCRFADGPASPGVRMQVVDEDGANSNIASRAVSVANVAPTVTLDGPSAADEGQTKSYTYSVADPGDDPNPAITESCGQNGTRVDTPESNDFQCRFPDGPASSTVSVTANDGDASNNTGSASTTVQVSNLAPGVTLSGPTSANEGATQDYTFTVTDLGQDTFTVKSGFPECGTGGMVVSGSLTTTTSGGSFRCRFPDGPASPNVRIGVADSDGSDSNVASRSVAVTNVAPTVSLSGPATANEGETKAYDFTVADPGQDTFTAGSGFPDCGSGNQLVSGSLTTAASGGSFRCRFADGPGSPSVRMQVSDEDGANSTVASRSVTVSNVAPTVELAGPTAADEGQTKTYTYSVTDPGDDPNPSVTEACGQNAARIDTPEANNFRCRFPDGPASPTVSVTADDGDASNNAGSASTTVQISNVAPTATLGGDATADEGQTKSYTFEVSDPGDDTFQFSSGFPRCGDNGRLEGTPAFGDRAFRCAFPDGPAATTVAVRVADSDGAESNTAGRDVTVSNVAPTVKLEGPVAADEGQTKAYTYTVNDPGADPNPSVTEDCGQNARKTDTPQAGGFDCTFLDGPASPTVSVAATDEDGGRGEASRRVEVANVAPTAGDDPAEGSYEMDEDASLSVGTDRGLLSNDADRGEDRLTARKVSDPERGTVQVSDDGSFVYRPDDDYNGDDSFTYEACDEDGACSARATARISVSPVNDAPRSADDRFSVDEDATLSPAAPGVLSNDADGDEDRLTARVAEGPSNGTLDLEADGSFVYKPGENFNGSDSFTYRANDGQADSEVATVGISVAPANDKPAAENGSVSAEEDGGPVQIDLGGLASDVETNNFGLSYEIVSGPGAQQGTLGGGGASRTFEPAANFNGTAEISYRVTDRGDPDGCGEPAANCAAPRSSDTGTVTVSVAAANDAPVNKVPGAQETDEDTPLVFSGADRNAISVADPDNGRLSTTVSATGGTLERRDVNSAAAAGEAAPTVTVEGTPAEVSEALDGLRFVPDANRNGDAEITVSTNDGGNTGSGGALTDEDTVAVAVEPVNDPPVAKDDAFDGREDEALTVDAPGVLSNDADVDGDPLAAAVADGPAHGDLELGANGSFVYTPDRDFNGADAFTYRVRDGHGGVATARADITIGAANDAPVVDLNGGDEGTDYSATFTEGDGPVAAVDQDALTATDVDDAEIRSATVSLQGRPDGDAEGLAANDSGTDVAASYDRSTGQLRLRGAALKADYQKVLRTVTYENTSQDPATADRELRFVATDSSGAESGAATSTVMVRAVNDAPEISDIPDVTTDEDTTTEAVPFTVRDVDTPADELTLSGSSDDAQLVPDSGIQFDGSGGERTVRVNPAADRFGSARITAEVSDGEATATDDFTLTIRDKTPPDAPSVDLGAASDTGASDTDNVTNNPRPVFSGEAEAGSEVEISDGNNSLRRITAEGGEWRYEVPAGMAFEDGEHPITATATDEAGNTSEASEPLNVVVDRRAPDTNIDSSPHDPTKETTASFRFHSDEENATFECFVDDERFEPCSSPKEYTDVSEGAHAFEARAIDRAGNVDPSPTMREWTVDTQAPNVSLTEPDDDALVREEVRIAADADDDLTLEKLEFLIDGEVVDVDRGAADDREEPYEFGWDTTLEEDGGHEIEARATDAAGNVTSTDPRTVRVDNTAPDTNVDSSPNSPTNAERISFAFSSPDGDVAFECSFNGREFVPCESPKEYPDEDFSGLTEGEHLFKVRAVDEAGNPDDSPAERVVVIDTQAPDAPTLEKPENDSLDNDGAIEFSGTAEPGSWVRILEVSGDATELRATARRTGEGGNWSVALAGVFDGGHTYVAVTTDAAGNDSGRSGERTVTVDTARPEVAEVLPHRDEADVPTNTDVEAIFSKRMDEATLGGNFMLTRERDGETVMVPATVTYDDEINTAILEPESELGYSEAYTATVRGGQDGARDRAGHTLAADETWSFTTSEEPDTTAPDAPAIEEPAEDAHFDDGAFTLSGTAEPDSRVRIFDAGERVMGSDIAVADQDGAWGVDLADVPEGRHLYAATATDAAHNESERSAQRSVTVDLTAPDTLIDASPGSVTNNTAANFRFRSNEAGATFECSMDGSRFERCASPLEYRGLSDGNHVFDVRAIDRAGNTDPSVAQRSFVVDTKAPEARLTEPAENALVRGEVRLRAEATDDRGVKSVEFLVEGKVVDSDLSGPYEFGWDSALVGDGEHTVEVLVFDEAGNRTTSAPRRIRVDNTVPDTHITQSPPLVTNGREATFAFSSEDASARFQCRLENGPYEACASPKQYENLSDGRHLFSVRAVDEAGNFDDSPAERRVEVDTTAPNARIDAAPSGTTRERTARVEFSSEPGATFRCQLDAEAFKACSSPLVLTGLSEGEHTLRVRATDTAGNTGPTVSSGPWTVDTTGPQVSIDSEPSGTVRNGTARFTFSSENGARFECKLDDGGFENCTSPKEYQDLPDGSHTFRVQATDAAGNTSAPEESSWTIETIAPDTVAPAVTKVSPTGKKAKVRSVAAAAFSEKLDAGTVNKATFRLIKKGTKKPVAATVRYDPANDRAVLKPTRKLVRGAIYTATVTTGVKDSAGNPLATNKTWRFKVR